ncbi:alkaline shock response membrane anchor protein AmaP [Sphaerisporangium sp. TRM90804]|uniref:alkaline shock response membrane anchor protein AmaP n=1 Tax=Sphaerisporangium sp. TRM90804 TaxID=3031113 RepID=UPI0024470F3D|nr:alkaline shock response membrane anchor protein AmaP [Sphaerisporangium sp. TRM90804]MDH2424415.1 alkaline shock response membrane anchor protein AmaP [Sphaerisporangium sp. TRM90804]
MGDRTGRVNRVGLTLTGLVLTVVGAAGLARGLGLLGPAHQRVVTPAAGEFTAANAAWFWPALALLGLIVLLLALRWLVIQARREAVRFLDLEHDTGHGTTRLGARTAAGAIEDDLREGPHGELAHATFSGAPSAPRLALDVTLPEDADPAGSARRAERGVTRLRQALEWEHMPAVIRIRPVRTHR